MAALSGPRGSHLLSTIFILLGCAALALSLSGNFIFGQRSAFTDEGQYWQGGMALFVDAMLAALSLFVGVLIAKKAYTSACAMGFIACLFGLASAYSLIGLGLSERVNKSRTLVANELRVDQTARINYEAQVNAANSYADTLDAKIGVTKDKTELALLLEQRRDAAKNVPQMAAPQITSALTDPQAQVMAEIAKRTSFHIHEEDFQLGSTILFALLVILGKAICFACAGYVRPREEEAVVALCSTTAPTPIAAESPPEPPARKPIVHKERLKIVSGSELRLVTAQAERKAVIQRFLRSETTPAPGNMIRSSDFHAAFVKWSDSRHEAQVGINGFGRTMRELGVKKHDGAACNYYCDLAIRGVPLSSSVLVDKPEKSNVTTLPLSQNRA